MTLPVNTAPESDTSPVVRYKVLRYITSPSDEAKRQWKELGRREGT